METTIRKVLPDIEEYSSLCQSVGWSEIINFTSARDSLNNSVYGVIAENKEGNTIGMGRIVGDGVMYFYIQDLVVRPEYQNHGVGTKIIAELINWLKLNAPPKSFIGLFATNDAEHFYRKFTLENRDLVGLFTTKELLDKTT